MWRKALGAVAVMGVLGAPHASAVPDPTSTIEGAQGDAGDRSITYVGRVSDQGDIDGLGLGQDGYWFAQFNAEPAVESATTGDNARDGLPEWIAPFTHLAHPADVGCDSDTLQRGCLPGFAFRTFSHDGPAHSAGGFKGWAQLRTPGTSNEPAECGTAGAIVDPHTFAGDQDFPDPTGVFSPPGDPEPNNNNTINRIQLQDGVPGVFYVGVVTDTTAGDYDPARLEIRGNVGMVDQREEIVNSQVEPVSTPGRRDLFTNGIPDIHVFRVEHFRSGDYLKLRLRGTKSAPAGFSGLLFDVPQPSGERASAVESDLRSARGPRRVHCRPGGTS